MTMPDEPTTPAPAAVSLRDRILNAPDIQHEVVTVPEWGVDVQVRSMSARERADMFQEAATGGELDFVKLFPSLVIACTYDPATGEKLFTAADLDRLLEKSGSALELVATAAMRVSGMDKDAAARAGKDSSSATAPSTTS